MDDHSHAAIQRWKMFALILIVVNYIQKTLSVYGAYNELYKLNLRSGYIDLGVSNFV